MIGTLRRNRAPRLTGRGASVINGLARLGLEDADEVRGDELLVVPEVEAVRPGYRRADTAEGGHKGTDYHRLRDSVLASVLGGEYENFREASPSVHLSGGELGGRQHRFVHAEGVYTGRRRMSTVILCRLIMP